MTDPVNDPVIDPVPDVPTATVELPSGAGMPLLGFGTWELRGEQARGATAYALECGYRHLDTALIYNNEREVGAALRHSGVDRSDVFVTTKIPPDRGPAAADVLRNSLAALGIEQVDLWLIHWPPRDGVGLDLWQALVGARRAGLARDIGVSNYPLEALDRLADATGVQPAVNQVRWSPLLYDRALLAAHRARGVVLEGHSGLRRGALDHPAVAAVAARTGRTPAQVIVRWHLQHEVVVIPRSRDRRRIAANADVAGFVLSAHHMADLDAAAG